MQIKRLSCPACHGNQFDHDDEGNLVCSFCGTLYASPRAEIVCRTCGVENPAQARKCMNCGRELGAKCPACYFDNIPGADHCENCGTPLDTIASIFEREKVNARAAVLRAERLVQSKNADMQFMEQERALMAEQERARMATLRAQQQQMIKRQRTILILGFGALACLLFGVGAVLLLLN